MPACKIILTDDHRIFRAGLKSLIAGDPQFEVIAQAGNGQELLDLLKFQKCDLVVLDLSMPEMDGMQVLKTLRQRYPRIKVVVLTMNKDPEHFKKALTMGAKGYVLKDDAFDQLVLAVKMVLKGKKFISPSVSRIVTDRYIRSMEESDQPSLELLTARERQILQLITEGFANKNIASRLKISSRTVETHRANLTNKLGIKTTAGLVRYAMAKGLD